MRTAAPNPLNHGIELSVLSRQQREQYSKALFQGALALPTLLEKRLKRLGVDEVAALFARVHEVGQRSERHRPERDDNGPWAARESQRSCEGGARRRGRERRTLELRRPIEHNRDAIPAQRQTGSARRRTD